MAQVNLRQLVKEEFKKCAADPIYFIRKHCVIQHPQKGRIPFALYDYQENAINDFQNFNYNIILKGRQIGISTAVACYALWLMLFHQDKNVLVIATKQDTAKTLITKVRFAFDSLPVYLQIPCVENNKLSLKFKNGSQIKAATAATDSGRSEALSLLILDEAAFIENAEEIWTAALPTLSTGGKAVLISTPNGVGNFFHKQYSDAITDTAAAKVDTDGKEEKMLFHPIKLDWRVHPERDDKWRKDIGKLQGEQKARQEYDAEFIGSGNTVIDADLIEKHIEKYMCDPLPSLQGKFGVDGNYWQWKERNFDRTYMVVADVARGDGRDFSACHVLDLESTEQIAEYKGKLSSREYGTMLVEIATHFNMALLVVERENVGWDVVQTILNLNYPNMFYMSKDHKVVDVHRTVGNQYRTDEKLMMPGFGTTMTTRKVMIDKLDLYMREIDEDGLIMHSKRFYEELRVFIWHLGHTQSKAMAMEGYNDDLIMALCIGLWVRDIALLLRQQGVDITKAALNSFLRTGVSESLASPIFMPNRFVNDPYYMPLGGQSPNGAQNSDDLRWLL